MSETQYYIATPGGEPSGPYSISALEAMAAAHELSVEHIYCAKGMPQWLPIACIVKLPEASLPNDSLPTVPVQHPSLPPIVTPPIPLYQNAVKPNTHLVGAIVLYMLSFVLFILALPFAIATLVQSARAEAAWLDVKYDECCRLSRSAGFWLKISVISLALQIVLLIGGCLILISEIH